MKKPYENDPLYKFLSSMNQDLANMFFENKNNSELFFAPDQVPMPKDNGRGMHLFIDHGADVSLDFLMKCFEGMSFCEEVEELQGAAYKNDSQQQAALFIMREMLGFIRTLLAEKDYSATPALIKKSDALNKLVDNYIDVIGG